MSELYEVDFEGCSMDAASEYDGTILWQGRESETLNPTLLDGNRDCLIVASRQGVPVDVKGGAVRFTASTYLDRVFRGQLMTEGGVREFHTLPLQDGDEIVCTLESAPYWSIRRPGRSIVSVVAEGPDEMGSQETLYAHFNRRQWLRLLPLLQFLKHISLRTGWTPPPLRACLMFDDPNLHGRTYGHIDLLEMARHARALAYHVSFAMVPFDAWHADRSVARKIIENQDCISLCMHGNNHSRNELAAPLGNAALMRLFAQGMQRIRKFEDRTGVAVSRVMVPPYGAFADRAVPPMLSLGYEAVCVSRSSLTSWNKGRAWPPGFGHPIAELVDGLPVIPRHVMARDQAGSYRLAAFLDQPIIPHGHHQDCAGGLGLVEDVVSNIQGLGDVAWMNMTTISRSNYLTKREDRLLRVKMLARRITVPIPEGVSEIVVERPWLGTDGSDERLFVSGSGRSYFSGVCGRTSAKIAHEAQCQVEVFSPCAEEVDFRHVPAPRLDLQIAGRRLLAETRDRVLPLLPRRLLG